MVKKFLQITELASDKALFYIRIQPRISDGVDRKSAIADLYSFLLYLVRRLRPNARVMRGRGVCMQRHDCA